MRTLLKCIKCFLNHQKIIFNKTCYSSFSKPPWRIMFFGTDNFSVSSLKSLNNELKSNTIIKNLEVVTTIKGKLNPVHNFAIKENLLTRPWPVSIVENAFDLGIVVSFGHLIPKVIIQKFPLGIINVHGSLLPRWRGAAPIIHAIASGDKKTGVTLMKIKPGKFDIGEIIMQHEIEISDTIKMPELHNLLAELGAKLLITCIRNLPQCLNNAIPQSNVGVTYAPKVDSNLARINWDEMSALQIYNLSRALYGMYPLTTTWNKNVIKLYDISIENEENNSRNVIPGSVVFRKEHNKLFIKCKHNTWISCCLIGLPTKKPMCARDFNNGYMKKELLQNILFK